MGKLAVRRRTMNDANGWFVYTTKYSAMCHCGHRLFQHMGVAPGTPCTHHGTCTCRAFHRSRKVAT